MIMQMLLLWIKIDTNTHHLPVTYIIYTVVFLEKTNLSITQLYIPPLSFIFLFSFNLVTYLQNSNGRSEHQCSFAITE